MLTPASSHASRRFPLELLLHAVLRHAPDGELVDAVRRTEIGSGKTRPVGRNLRLGGKIDAGARSSRCSAMNDALPPSVANRTTVLISLTKSHSANDLPPFSASVSVNSRRACRIERDLERIAVARSEIRQAASAGFPRPCARNAQARRSARTQRPARRATAAPRTAGGGRGEIPVQARCAPSMPAQARTAIGQPMRPVVGELGAAS